MATHDPTSSVPAGTSSVEQLRQRDDELVTAVTEQLQAQLQGNMPLPHEARKLLEDLSAALTALPRAEEDGTAPNHPQSPMVPSLQDSKKRKADDGALWTPEDTLPSKRQCRIVSPTFRRSRARHSKVVNERLTKITEGLFRFNLRSENWTEISVRLYGVPGSVPQFDDDDESSDESVVPSLLSSPEVRPSTPETNASSCAPPSAPATPLTSLADADISGISDRVTGVVPIEEGKSEGDASAWYIPTNDVVMAVPQQDEAVKYASTKDEEMSDDYEGILNASAEDESMSDTTESLLAGLSGDSALCGVTEHLQSDVANDVHMTLAHEDDSGSGPTPVEPRQDSAMQDASILLSNEETEQPATQTLVTEPEQGIADMEDVQSSVSISSSCNVQSTTPNQQSTAALTLSRWNSQQPSTNDQTEQIWHDLTALGPNFHTDLQNELDDGVVEEVPDLHQAVEKHIRTTKTSAGLINLLKLHNNAGRLSLPQTNALKDCVVEARARNAATPDDNMQDIPAAPFQELLMPPSERPQEQRREASPFVADAPQQHYLAAKEPVRTRPQALGAADPLTDEVLKLIQQAAHTLSGQPKLLRRFGAMFVLPLHDDAEMKRIVQCITKYKSLETLREYAAPDLLYDCRKFSQAKEGALKKTKHVVSYDARRPDSAAKIFNFIAVSNFRVLKNADDNGCLTWQGIQKLVEREEGHFFQPAKRLADLSIRHYKAYIDERLAHWKDPENLRSYIAQLNGDAQLTVGKLVLAPSTAIKRGGDDLDLDDDDKANGISSAQPRQGKRRQMAPVSNLDQANVH
ncbi:hypothetical protein EKO04_007191 [Ascochyta lentis]|uniref:Uncharacterized protein n=1 Tax=Ascochyta lentis TaxID=205686 RepID=A0A8H7MHN6_9PLEO|nr:hypothetical protein EKO04_007191 [Ascochyta lentis]